jgi:hypothetical protein
MQATNPTHVESIGMTMSTKPERNKEPGRNGMTSNGGWPAAALAGPASAVVTFQSECGQRNTERSKQHRQVDAQAVTMRTCHFEGCDAEAWSLAQCGSKTAAARPTGIIEYR